MPPKRKNNKKKGRKAPTSAKSNTAGQPSGGRVPFGPPRPPAAAPTRRSNDDASTDEDNSAPGLGRDSASDDDSNDSIPPLARRDDSSTSSDDDSSEEIPPPLSANSNRRPSQAAATGPPSSVTFESSSSEGSDGEDLSDDDASDDYSSDDIPALVQRDESSQSSGDSDTSMPALVNRSNEKKPPTRPVTSTQSTTAEAATTKKKKNKKKKKKKSPDVDTSVEAPLPGSPSKTAIEDSGIQELLSKFGMMDDDATEVYLALTSSPNKARGFHTGPQRMEMQLLVELAHDNMQKLASFVGLDISMISRPAFIPKSSLGDITVDDTLGNLFISLKTANNDPLWTLLDEGKTSPILQAALTGTVESLKWFERNASTALDAFVHRGVRQVEVTMLLDAGVQVNCKSVAALFSKLDQGAGHQFNNETAKMLCERSTIVMSAKSDYKLVMSSISGRLSKNQSSSIKFALGQASERMRSRMEKNRHVSELPPKDGSNAKSAAPSKEDIKAKKADEEYERKRAALSLKTNKITGALQWYTNLLQELAATASKTKYILTEDDGEEQQKPEDVVDKSAPSKSKTRVLSSEEVMEALDNCESEDALVTLESGVDIFNQDGMSTWTIDITETAHKWFKRHLKKDRVLCERVIRRLTLLSTGRWPYVLCKPLKAKPFGQHGRKIHLYETKIDAASRIIWEVAIAFSPRRSTLQQNFCEQVIRVWDVVLDHDNLSRAIDQTIDRISKSHLRGEDCAIYAELDKKKDDEGGPGQSLDDKAGDSSDRIPRVFPMSSEVIAVGSSRDSDTSDSKSRHFHPGHDDPRQYTLLKFYELNSGAVKLLLDSKDDQNMDLPFTPGPKEHEIIHYKTDPQRSVLLMGRSGTGKTTCLVFRMWAQYASYADVSQGPRPRQLFVTKNEVLCREVERSFRNMGLAWLKRGASTIDVREEDKPKFITSAEWLDRLDVELPGDRFFTGVELKQRLDKRKHNDAVTKGIEALLSEENVGDVSDSTSHREEMTFLVFRRLWRKIRSGSGSQIDGTMVWREIKSFIKGSVAALHVDKANEDRKVPSNRFLSLEEYLALPRKQSRMDETQRREIYDLFLSYEKLKREGNYYDEMDLVYNLAGRITLVDHSYLEKKAAAAEEFDLLPIDSLFVDEVQDFTQAELYVLTKLCQDPNNLFLAGDTAQSIAVGVDFRFTDVRQIFYNSFGGIEPKLLQLSHNYRSHAGVLRLAACVVELLYHFFGASLDRLPPDLGLFDGPKPVIMDVGNTHELLLMLQGAKRETSRIEFGAHQVVIVRNEEAKKTLPNEFGIDPDWVMTVQESKGLEFDDVLLYNFFSDSPAEDLWRVASNYSESDIATYYADSSVAASGVQSYDWDDAILQETRHLDFVADQHKILETELKMLYTAITRARINIFIAETNTSQSLPMFNYFQRRRVVDVVNKDLNEGGDEELSGVRVFGAMNSVDDWRNRGEYYLRNAEGERQIGCLRLAAKCFDKAGEPARKNHALACLTFAEMDNQDMSKLRGKKAVLDHQQKLYEITEQLLEARDVGFLDKAALCLLRTGEQEEYTAKLFEMYGKLRYTQRFCEQQGEDMSPDDHEKKYFGYAARLFVKCSQESGGKFELALDSFRNLLAAGMYQDAVKLIESETLLVNDKARVKKVYDLYINGEPYDVLASLRRSLRLREDAVKCLLDALKSIAANF